MTLVEAKEIAGSLSIPSKMPGYAYSLPAKSCKRGQELYKIQNSVCSKCYARKGNYNRYNVINALDKRLSSLTHPLWVDAMCTLIEDGLSRGCVHYFRWHDSGDLQSVDHLENIIEIANKLPYVNFWLPTKEVLILQDYRNRYLIFPGWPRNLTIRISAEMIDSLPDTDICNDLQVGGNAVNTHDMYRDKQWMKQKVHFCTAFEREGKCGECRSCWCTKYFPIVSYTLH
jgi:hypothetical protein